jgi:dienelactone hydrolase
VPGVVFSNGHWCLDHRDVSAVRQQNVILNTVMLGVAVLAYDSIGQGERTQYLDPATNRSRVGGCTFDPDTCVPTGEAHNEENYIGRQAWLTDVTTPSLWVWDSLRAVDLLASRPEVDAARLGAMGCSGGGTQTAFLAAVDPRIHLSVVACYSSTFEREWEHGGVSTQYQHFSRGFASGLDKQDLYVARAPRPTLQLVTTDDPAFPLQGARDMLSSAFPAFEALGDGAALEGHEAVFAHGWLTPNNEAMYRFMALHFGLPAAVNTTERAFAPLPCRTLTVTQTGRAMDSLPGVGGRGPYRDLQTPQD